VLYILLQGRIYKLKYVCFSEAHIHGINVYSLHPGIITTELGRHFSTTIFPGASTIFRLFMRPILKNPEQGAQTTIYCSVAEQAANETGLYYR